MSLNIVSQFQSSTFGHNQLTLQRGLSAIAVRATSWTTLYAATAIVFQRISAYGNPTAQSRDTMKNTAFINVFNNYDTLAIPELHKLQLLCFVHKYFYRNHQLPTSFMEYFSLNTEIHGYLTRSSNNLHLTRVNTSYGSKCLKYSQSVMECSTNRLEKNSKCLYI